MEATHGPRLFAAAALALGIAAALAPAASAQRTMHVTLDSRATAGPARAQTAGKLRNRAWYVVVVKGTVSYYLPSLWSLPPAGADPDARSVCGTPEPAPMFASPGVAPAPVGADAEIVFARPAIARRCQTPVLPARWRNFQFRVAKRSGFKDPTPVTGRVTRAAAGHRYRYTVKGRGVRARFRLSDTPALDNYGRLRIAVRRAKVRDCRRFGVKAFRTSKRRACARAVGR